MYKHNTHYIHTFLQVEGYTLNFLKNFLHAFRVALPSFIFWGCSFSAKYLGYLIVAFREAYNFSDLRFKIYDLRHLANHLSFFSFVIFGGVNLGEILEAGIFVVENS